MPQTHDFDEITYSTHLVDFGAGKSSELAIVCGKYCRSLRKSVFGGSIKITGWYRLPINAILIPCRSLMIQLEGSGPLNTSDNH